MSMTGLEAFDSTIHKTNAWLNDLMARLGSHDRHEAYHALRTVLHVLRDRLTVEEAVQFGAQLPMLIRGFYYEGWNPAGKPNKLNKQEFLTAVRDNLRPTQPPDPEEVTRAVLAVLVHHVSPGEVGNIKNILPKALRDLWPED